LLRPIEMANKEKEFYCINCRRKVFPSRLIGTAHRNHCPYCLYSLDVDLEPGDRKSKCLGRMEPIGLTLKHEGEKDKYGRQRVGELMIVHQCLGCKKISINRIAGDDISEAIIGVFEKSKKLSSSELEVLREKGIAVLMSGEEVRKQLFGRE